MPNATSRAVVRLLSAFAGALGALPLVAIARGAAERFSGLPALPGAERLLGDVKQASYAEAAVLCAAVPAAALFFGRIFPDRLESRGVPFARAQGAGIAFGVSLLLWRSGVPPKASLLAGLLLAAAVACGPWIRHSRVAAGAALLALFLGGLFAAWRPDSRLDLFEDGQILFGAALLADGARPYLDHYPVHGWGADGGWDALFFSRQGRGLRTFRLVRTAMTALALALLATAAWLFFSDAAWAAAAVAACLAFCPFLSDRHMAALFAVCALIRAARSAWPRRWMAAGVFSGIALFATLDFGVIVLAAGAFAPLALHVLARDSRRTALEGTLRFGAGALLGASPFAAALASRGALGEFLRVSFCEIPATITQAWGLPADRIADALRDGSVLDGFRIFTPSGTPSLCALLVLLLLAAVVLTFRSRAGAMEPVDRAATVALLLMVFALRGVLGRADAGHRILYGLFAGLPASWLFFRLVGASPWRFRWAVRAVAAAAFFLVLRPDRVALLELAALSNANEIRRIESLAAGALSADRASTLPLEQLVDLAALRGEIDAAVPSGKTFFDFGNEPGLYFLLNRKPPIRYSCVPLYETRDKQLEVIAALERHRPPVAILSSEAVGVMDGVPNRERAPLVATYLDAHYVPYRRVGSRTLGVLRRER